MFLSRLIIKDKNKVLRDISFKKGINFIVDKTPITGGKESGNNVGKTTVLRIIDYCLGSKGKDIYSDVEFTNSKDGNIKQLLEDLDVIVTLNLLDDLDKPKEELVIERNFLPNRNSQIILNGRRITHAYLLQILNLKLFNNENEKPTFRSLIAKFIRDDSWKMSRTIRYLHQTTSNIQYEAIHLFLFGIRLSNDVFGEKQQLTYKLSIEEKVINRLTETFTENALRQALIIIERDIVFLESQKALYNHDYFNQNEIESLNKLKREITETAKELGENELKYKLALDSIDSLRNNINSIDIEDLQQLYEDATALVPNLNKKFLEVVTFHNSMLNNKISFIQKQIEPIRSTVTKMKGILEIQLKEESKLSEKLNLEFNLERYNLLNKELNTKYELKGNREERLNQIIELKASITEKKKRIEELNQLIETIETNLSSNEEVFNQYFSAYSKALYDEEYFISHDHDDNGNLVLGVKNIQANVGGGKKKGQIAAFDLAYVQFCAHMNITAPRFVLHDSTEDISINQLMEIANLAGKINGQYILAILSDKFSSTKEAKDLIENNNVIELNQEEKLFKF